MKKILIVDDQPDIRELIEVTLDMGSYELLLAGSGPEALKMVNENIPDLILLDVMMAEGDIDGFAVCKEIKSSPKTKHIIVIMVTAKGQNEDKKEGLKAGADGYFVKPFSPLDLIRRIEKELG